jgi:DNA-binding transcriptional MerR regulator
VTVNELARRAGIPAHVVRYYTQRGLLSPARNSRNAYREYGETDLHRLRFICKAKIIGLTLSEIDMILGAVDDDAPRLSPIRDLLRSRAERYREELASAQRLQQRIMEALELWNEADVSISEHVKLRRLIDAVVLAENSAAAGSTRD